MVIPSIQFGEKESKNDHKFTKLVFELFMQDQMPWVAMKLFLSSKADSMLLWLPIIQSSVFC